MGTMTVLRVDVSAADPARSSGRSACWAASAITCCSIGRALGGMPHAAVHFRKEIVRLIAEISMGAGTLAMIGGTVVIVGFLTLAAGGTLAVQGYSLAGQHRHRGADRVLGGVHQRAHLRAGGGRASGWPPPSAPG